MRACAYRSDADLKRYIENAVEVDPDRPVLVDKYLDRADELDVDALCDKDGNFVICGIMQHIEQAGVHSGAGAARSSVCCVPPLCLQSALNHKRVSNEIHGGETHWRCMSSVIRQSSITRQIRTPNVRGDTLARGWGAGDSACSIPPQTIAAECLDVIRDWTPKLAKALKVVGLINIQYCVQDNNVRGCPATPCPWFRV